MANPKLATTDYVDGEVAKKQEYFADVFEDESTGNRDIDLKDANANTVGQIIVQKEGGILFTNVATPKEATDGTNKGYADDNFANAFKGSASGAAIRVDDVSPIEHSMGVQLYNKNLIAQPYTTPAGTYSGVTVTIDSDRKIHLSGTATSRIVFFVRQPSLGPVLTVGKQYTMSGYISGSGANLGIQDNTYHAAYTISTAGGTQTFKAAYTAYYVFITVNAGVTTDAVIQPYLEEGSTATDYVPYISDFSSVTLTRAAKNLIPYPYITSNTRITMSGVTFTVNADRSISVKGTATETVNFYCNGSSNLIPVVKQKCVLSGCPAGGSRSTYGMYYYDTVTSQYDFGEGVIFTAIGNVNIIIRVFSGATVDVTFKPQLELGSEITPYSLSKNKTYTPNADGSVPNVKSLSPTTTLLTNNVGAIIDCTYNQDSNALIGDIDAILGTMFNDAPLTQTQTQSDDAQTQTTTEGVDE